VIPEHRGHGVGRALLKELARIAIERDCGRLEWSVLDWNRDAIGFYERLGATPNSEWTVYRLTGEALTELGRE
jgi:GNAT superfamily N-acetyltransferase